MGRGVKEERGDGVVEGDEAGDIEPAGEVAAEVKEGAGEGVIFLIKIGRVEIVGIKVGVGVEAGVDKIEAV